VGRFGFLGGFLRGGSWGVLGVMGSEVGSCT
jgi:hypothetical protein